MTRAVRVGAALWGAGLVWMVVAGLRSDRYWGFFTAEPRCVLDGECTFDDLATFQRAAWDALRPGALLVAVGAVLVLVAVLRATGREPVPTMRPGAATVGLRAAATTLAVGAVATLPLVMAVAIGPPLGVAVLTLTATGLTGALTGVLRRGLGRWRAAAVALLASFAGAPPALGVGAALAGAGEYGTALVAGASVLVVGVAGVAALCSSRLPGPAAVGAGS